MNKRSRKIPIAEALELRRFFNAPGAGWALTFDDEFNGTSLDTSKWSNYLPWTNGSTGNNQYEGSPYLDYMVNANTTISGVALTSNLSVSGGQLHLSTQETSTFTVGSQSFNFTGAMITTGLNPYRTFSSGYFEIRAQMPQGAGNWPAFWMTNGWPPEDDIMEYKPSGGPWNHQGLYGMDAAWHDNTTTGSNVPSSNWHTYALEWAPGVQTFFIDGIETYQTSTGVPGSANPEYLLLNSGIYSGQQSGFSNSNNNTLNVDYVRVYGYTGTATPSIANAGFNTAGSWSFNDSNASIVTGGTIGQTGTGDLHIDDAGVAYQTLTGLSPNTTYTFTGFGEDTGSTQGVLGVNNSGGTAVTAPIGASLAWASGSVTFTTGPSNTTANIYCENLSTSSNVYFDDMNLVEPPVLNSINAETTSVSTPKAIPLNVTTGSAGSNFSIAATSSNVALVPASGLAITGSGSSETLTVTPQPGLTGTTTITLTTTDVLGGLYTETFNLTVATATIINGDLDSPGENDVFRLVRSGSTVNLYQNSPTPTQQFNYTSVGTMIINGLGGNNQLILDYSGGDPVVPGGINFNGGTGSNSVSVINMSGGTSATISNGSLSLGSDSISFSSTQAVSLDLGSGSSTLLSTTPTLTSVLTLAIDSGSSLSLAASSTLPGNAIVNDNGAFSLNNQSQAIDQLTGTGTMNIGTGTLTIGEKNGSSTFAGSITGTGGLTKTGTGTFVLAGSDSFTGAVTVGSGATNGGNVDGILQITTAAALSGVTQVNFTDNNSAYATLQLNGSAGAINLPTTLAMSLAANSAGAGGTAAPIIDSLAGTNKFSGPLSLQVGGAGYGISVDSGMFTIAGLQSATSHVLFLSGAGAGVFTFGLGGTASLAEAGPGVWTLNSTNNYSGYTNVSGGTLNLSSGASLASTNINISAGGTFNALGSLATAAALNANGTVNFGPSTTSGILVRKLASLSIGSGGIVTLPFAANHQYRTLLVPATLNFAANTGTLDLSNNDLDAPSASLALLSDLIAIGYNSGTWTGAGITSSAAAADSTHLTALGVMLNNIAGTPLYGSGDSLGTFDGTSPGANDVLVKFTYYGDTNLDGKVDGSDYSRIDNGSLNTATGWTNGDLNYDGVIDGSDYTLIDNASNAQTGDLSTSAEVAASSRKSVAASFVPPSWTSQTQTPFSSNVLSSFLDNDQEILTDHAKSSLAILE